MTAGPGKIDAPTPECGEGWWRDLAARHGRPIHLRLADGELVLVGDEEQLRARLRLESFVESSHAGPGRISLRHATQVVSMAEPPSVAFKHSQSSAHTAWSLHLALEHTPAAPLMLSPSQLVQVLSPKHPDPRG